MLALPSAPWKAASPTHGVSQMLPWERAGSAHAVPHKIQFFHIICQTRLQLSQQGKGRSHPFQYQYRSFISELQPRIRPGKLPHGTTLGDRGVSQHPQHLEVPLDAKKAPCSCVCSYLTFGMQDEAHSQ